MSLRTLLSRVNNGRTRDHEAFANVALNSINRLNSGEPFGEFAINSGERPQGFKATATNGSAVSVLRTTTPICQIAIAYRLTRLLFAASPIFNL